MNVELQLYIAPMSGIQLRIIRAMKKLGMQCKNLFIQNDIYGEKELIVELNGPEMDQNVIIDVLKKINGVSKGYIKTYQKAA